MTTLFTTDHEWLQIDGDVATIGITKFAAEQLGDVVFVELPATGKKVSAGGEAAVVESVKAASEVYAPAGGEVTAARKPGNVAGVADDGPGDDGADAEDLGEGGVRGTDRGGELLLGLAELAVEVAQVSEKASAGTLRFEDMASATAEIGARMASDPWRFWAAVLQMPLGNAQQPQGGRQ